MVKSFFKRKTSTVTRYLIVFITSLVIALVSFAAFIALAYDNTTVALILIIPAAAFLTISFRNMAFYSKGIKTKREIEGLLKEGQIEALMANVKAEKGNTLEASMRYVMSVYALVDLGSVKIYPTLLGHYQNYKNKNKKVPKILADALMLFTKTSCEKDYKAVADSHIETILKIS